jgi:hypothetical protein
MLNLISETMPLVACFLVRRPVLRAACGAFFVIETVALATIMELWNPHWLPLAAVFVDWEALLAWLGRPRPVPRSPAGWRPPRAASVFVAAFVTYEALVAFSPHGLDQRLGTYPFSGFPMFATIRARKPYGEHQPYSVAGIEVELVANHATPIADRWLAYDYRKLAQVHDPVEMSRRVADILHVAQATSPAAGIRAVRVYLAIFEDPAPPAAAGLVAHRIALLGVSDGSFHSMLGHTRASGGKLVVSPGATGVSAPPSELIYYRDDRPEPHVLATGPGPWIVARVTGAPTYFVAIADGQPWLVEATDAYRR